MPPKNHNKFLAWILAHNIKTSNGIPFEFTEHLFALDPLLDWHPNQGINKSAQVGFSEMMILKTIYMSACMGLNIGYSLDSSKDMDNFTKTKFDAILRANPYLQSLISGNMEKKVVKFEDSERFIHLVGAYNSSGSNQKEQTTVGISFTADVLIHDEASRSDQYVIDQLRSRVLNSKYKWRWLFDNPLYPGTGADAVYQKSDQKHWIIKCSGCGYRQYMDFYPLDKFTFEQGTNHCFIDPNKKIFICGKCGKEITNAERLAGEWVAKRPAATDYRGYWINQLMYVRHSAADILRYNNEMTSSVFMNMVLGKPYIGSDITITREAISENICTRSHDPIRGKVALGVDCRIDEYQYVLRDSEGLFEFGRVKSIKDIEMIMNKWDAKCVIDMHPNTSEVKRFAKKYPYKVWYALFKPEADQSVTCNFSPANDKNLVLIRREDMLDNIADKYNNAEASINIGHATMIKEFADEYSNLVRTTQEDSKGNQRPVWVKVSDACDFPFADLYAFAALQKIPTDAPGVVRPKPMSSIDKTMAKQDTKTPQEVYDSYISGAKRVRLR